MSVYLMNLQRQEEKLTGEEVCARFREFTDAKQKERFLQVFLGMTTPVKETINAWERAVHAFARAETPKFILDFDKSDRNILYNQLFKAIVKHSPANTVVAQAAQVFIQREKDLEEAKEQRRIKARQEYEHILNATAQGHYGEKLKQLIEGGWVTLGAPSHGDSYMSKTEKQTYHNKKTSILQADFGVSRPIEGTIPNEHDVADRLALHEHCSCNGAIQAASIQKISEAGFPGITKRWLEKESLAYFKSVEITRAKLLGV